MYQLSRTVRFAINPPETASTPGPNGYAGNPPSRGLSRHYELVVKCAGDLDPRSGYLLNIKEIDRAVRSTALPIIQQACHSRPNLEPGELMPELLAALSVPLKELLSAVLWKVTPYYSVEMSVATTSSVLLRQKFDFCASHRLHVPSLSTEENRALFGKCNHPSGHGHNYQFEPCVQIALDASSRQPFTLRDLESLADATIVQRFDHKNLNTDTVEFKDGPGGGVNPSVENIARICFELLDAAMRRANSKATLKSITAWESDRTSCTYPA
jgi:6-pyruvoyltetrahydropterin/6-carboxytetrahydropterin synthase